MPDNEEFKFTAKIARRKLEVPMPAAMLCRTPIKEKTAAVLGNARPDMLVLLMPTNQ